MKSSRAHHPKRTFRDPTEILIGIGAAAVGGAVTLFGLAALQALATGEAGGGRTTAALVFATCLAAALWCFQVSWRLITGRERTAGGLVSPVTLIAAGVLFFCAAMYTVLTVGSRAAPQSLLFSSASVAAFSLAVVRFRSIGRSRQS